MPRSDTKAAIHSSNRKLIRIMIPYYKQNLSIFLTDLLCAAGTTVYELVLPILLSYMINAVQSGRLTLRFTLVAVAIYIALRVLEIGARYYMQSLGHIMGARIETAMRSDVYEHLQTLPEAYFSTHPTGAIMARLTTDLFDVTEFAHHCPEEYFIGGIKAIVAFVVLIRVNVPLTLVLFTLIPLMFVTMTSYRKRMRQTQMSQRKKIGAINARIEDTFLGVKVVKSFANEALEAEKFERDNVSFLSIKERFYRALAGFSSVTRIFDALMMTVVMLLGGISLVTQRLDAGAFVAFILYTQALLSTVMRVVEFTEQFERGMTGLECFREIMHTQSDIVEKPDAIPLKDVKGEIRFAHVTFQYPEAQHPVLVDFDVTIPAGKKVALVGPSGGGKTTMTNLIPRFYDVSQGAVLLDGVDVRDVTLQSLRENIGMVQQDVYLFRGSVASNIAYGKPNATHEEIVAAARLAGAEEFILQLPNGYDTEVGERGVLLSGGQRQRLSIARVFLKNPPILILDEATSALDNESEHYVQQSLEALSRGRTTITIAHRLSTIRHADEILVLTESGIVERGTHDELMVRRGRYYEFYQFVEATPEVDAEEAMDRM